MKIGPPVTAKKILKGIYIIKARRPFWSYDQLYINKISFPLYLQAYIQNSVKNGQVVSEKASFNFDM